MGRRVDAAREAGDDHMSLLANLLRQLPGKLSRQCGGIAGAHDGDAAAGKEAFITLDAKQRRRGIGLSEQGRI